MVEAQAADSISRLVRERTQMTISELVPFLAFEDLAHFYSLNKTCKAIMTPTDAKCLRFDVLFAKQSHEFAMPNWRELLTQEIERSQTFGRIMVAARNSLLSSAPKLMEHVE